MSSAFMENKMKKTIIFISLCFLLAGNFCFSDEAYIEDILWVGCDDINEPYPKTCQNNTEKQVLLNKGLTICESRSLEGSSIHQLLLASYHYFTTKNTKKALYWANKCAEQGNTSGMLILFDAYKSGNGVIGDAEEGLKWLWLASSLKNEHAKNIMQNAVVVDLLCDRQFANLVYEKSRQWMRDHPEAFFNPN
jgi:TPR repeat protein